MKTTFSLTSKIAFVGLLFTIPIGALARFLAVEKTKVMDFAAAEVAGVNAVSGVTEVLFRIAELRGSVAVAESDLGEADLKPAESALAAAISSLVVEQGKSSAGELEKQWQGYAAAGADFGARGAALQKMTDTVLAEIVKAADSSNLTLDPDLDTYYLMDAMVLQLPRSLANIAAVASKVMTQPKKASARSDQDLIDLALLTRDVEASSEGIKGSTQKAVAADEASFGVSKALQTEVNEKTAALANATAQLLSVKGVTSTEEAARYQGIVTNALRSAKELSKVQGATLSAMLQARIDDFSSQKWTALSWVAGGWLAALAFLLLISRSVGKSMKFVVGSLNRTAADIQDNSRRLGSASQRAASSATQEAAAIQESVAAMTEITSMIKQTALHAESATEAAGSMLTLTKSGNDTMTNLSKSMERIESANSRLKDITRIIEDIASRTTVINDIVFKTQLLAVNASIEAARAGQYGKGFAVVANEVGNLATLSGKASSEIRQLLDDSRVRVSEIVAATNDSVNSGNAVAREASDVFQDLSQSISVIGDKVRQIFDATREQDLGVRQTTQALGDLNSSASTNNAVAAENAELAGALLRQGEGLVGIESLARLAVFGSRSQATAQRSVAGLDGEAGFDGGSAGRYEARKGHASLAPSLLETKSTKARVRALSTEPSSLNVVIGSKSDSKSASLAAKIAKKAGSRRNAGDSASVSVGSRASTSLGEPVSSRFEWQSSLDIGVEAMNDDHKRLLKLMADLEAAVRKGVSSREQLSILGDLADFTVKHFRQEETYLESIQYPDLATHKLIHKNLLDRLNGYASKFKGEGQVDDEFFDFLRTWLTAHIMGVDMKYGEYSNRHSRSA